MKKRTRFTVLSILIVAVTISVLQLVSSVHSQGSEPRFSFPGAGRFVITSYFDHTQPDVFYNTVDNKIDIYTTERGQQSNNCSDCFWSGSVQVCGYYTVLQDAANCGAAGGRRIFYDMHPAFDYGFPMNTTIAAAAPGTAFQRDILGFAVVINHGNNYFTKYGHVNRDSRITHNTQVVRGQQVALSSNTGTGAAHLHFEARYEGENGTVFDPYGWWGPWYTDNWNLPFGHMAPWWRSGDPIPMGYRDQNDAAHGPFQISGAIASKWDALNGAPGSPISPQQSGGSCPIYYGECQFFEKGYLEQGNSSVVYHNYTETLVSRVHYVAARDSNTILTIQNQGGVPAQVSVIFSENGHIVDSRTYTTLANGATWQLNVQQTLDELTNHFIGIVTVYSSQPLAVTIAYNNPLPTVFVPLVSK